MTIRRLWLGVAAYFFVFWYAVGDFGLAFACTFFLVVIASLITYHAFKAALYQAAPEYPPEPHQPANLDQPPR